MSVDLQNRLEFALEMARRAADLILRYYQTRDFTIESKADDSPVTIADRGAEELMRRLIQEKFPGDGVLGEEFDDLPSSSGYRWILDPIDGTKAFIHGVPLFGTLIGVEYEQRMVAGVCGFPALNEVVYAAEGGGCWWKTGDAEPRRTHVSGQSDLSRSRLMFTEPTAWKSCGRHDVMTQLMERVKIGRGWGDCYGHIMVATGRAEIAVDPMMSAWDIAALIPILRESGGYCVDWKGNENIEGGDGVSVNAALRDAVLAILREAPAPTRR